MVIMKFRFICISLLLLAAGCGTTPQQGASPTQEGQTNGQVKVQQTIPPKPKITNPQEVAAHLEAIAARIPRVRKARCVVFGNTAVVGIDVDPHLDRSHIGTVKYSVAEALRKDPYGAHAVVTADMDLNQRLRNIRDDIINGRPISGFANQMSEIIGRIMPQLPQDITPGSHPTDTDHSQDAKQVPQGNL
jgi:YhcN/YlaJ family sporulation lipoprotein